MVLLIYKTDNKYITNNQSNIFAKNQSAYRHSYFTR